MSFGAAACVGPQGPYSIQSTVEFQTDRGVVRGVSTQEGIFAFAEIAPPTGELSFRFRTGDNFFDDVATLQRKSDVLALFAPKSSRLNQARFATYPAAADDKLYLEVRTDGHTDILACHLLDAGVRGDFVALDEKRLELADVAHRFAGVGVFAWRDGSMQLVGMLNGVYCEEPRALAFIGLDEMATLIPVESDYFVRRVLPHRADFEYGTPRDFEGEKVPVSDPSTSLPQDAPTPARPPTQPVEGSKPTGGATPPNGGS
jgi:hypothetical protein